ncbi:uncharacterized protein [Haliotis asinina]|uniref:uncharacterized protein n=1 Tax=Haliotis asinina TaxID=109174 RepID=UPI0035325EA0
MVTTTQLFRLIWIVPRANPLIWTPKQTSGCFGTGSSDFDFLNPECQPGEIIALKDFYAGSKSTYLSCPSESTDLNRNHSKSCTYAEDDCQFHLDGQGKGLRIYTNCTGTTDCTVRVDRIKAGRPCDVLTHLTPANSMLMNYYCIPENLHQSVSDQSVFNGSTLYLYNNKYPKVVHLDSNHACSVSAPCGSEITATALYIRLQYNAGGSCAQHLLLQDGESTLAIDCAFNNNFVVKSVF